MKKISEFITRKLLPVALMTGIGIVSGIMIGKVFGARYGNDLPWPQFLMSLGFGLVMFYVALMVQIIIHEGGHYLFGKLTGYKFVSFRVFSFMWRRDKEGIRFAKYSLAGTGGQCLMEPPGECGSDFPVVLYNMGGVLINLISAGLFFLLSRLFAPSSFLRLFFLILCIAGAGLAITNGIPLKAGISNDGSNTIDLVRNPKARRAFWIMTKGNALINDGISIADMPEEWFVMPEKEDMNNAIVAYLPYAACDRLLSEKKFDEANELRRTVQETCTALPGIYRLILREEDVFYELTHECRKEVLDKLHDEKFAKTVKSLGSMPTYLRTECIWAKKVEKDEQKFMKLRNEYEKVMKDYPNEVEKRLDRELMDMALATVEEA
jgi:hypothetical protein